VQNFRGLTERKLDYYRASDYQNIAFVWRGWRKEVQEQPIMTSDFGQISNRLPSDYITQVLLIVG